MRLVGSSDASSEGTSLNFGRGGRGWGGGGGGLVVREKKFFFYH